MKRTQSKILALLLAVVLAVGLVLPAAAAAGPVSEAPEVQLEGKIVILQPTMSTAQLRATPR